MIMHPIRSAFAQARAALIVSLNEKMPLALGLQIGSVAILVSGCGPVPIKAEFDSNVVEQKIERRIGVYYDQDLRNYEYIFRTGGGDSYLVKLGPGTITLLNSVFQSMFQASSETETHPLKSAGASTLDGIVVPRIKSFLGRTEKFWLPTFHADITYEFTLYEPDGSVVTSWETEGAGEQQSEAGFDHARWPGMATDMAMEASAKMLYEHFQTVPELIWWKQGLRPAVAAVEPVVHRAPEIGADFGSNAVSGSFQDAVTVIIDPYIELARLQAAFGATEWPNLLLPVRLIIKNDSDRTLQIRRSQVQLNVSGSRAAEQFPSNLVARVLTERRGGTMMPPPGVGVASLPLLFVALLDTSERLSEQKELSERFESIKKRSLDVVSLGKGETADGFLYFDLRSVGPTVTSAILTVPFVDMNETHRYEMRLPLPTLEIETASTKEK